MNRVFRHSGGFSLIELLVVVGIITILSGIVMVSAPIWVNRARTTGTQARIDVLTQALLMYYEEQNRRLPPADRLVECLMSPNRQGEPYYQFNESNLGEGAPGQIVKYEQVRLRSIGSIQPVTPLGTRFVLDDWRRPIYYVPVYQYDDPRYSIYAGWFDRNGNNQADAGEGLLFSTGTRNFIIWSAGSDGIMRVINTPGGPRVAPMPYNNNRDDDGDGLIDLDDNLRSTRNKPGLQSLPEDDIIRGE